MVYISGLLWLFHFCLVLVLISSKKTVFNVVLMTLELFFFIVHLRINVTARRKHNKKVDQQANEDQKDQDEAESELDEMTM